MYAYLCVLQSHVDTATADRTDLGLAPGTSHSTTDPNITTGTGPRGGSSRLEDDFDPSLHPGPYPVNIYNRGFFGNMR